MKRFVLTAALSLAVSGPIALAQQPAAPPSPDVQDSPRGGPEGPSGHRHAPDPHREALMLSKRLNLTTDQTTRLEPILADRQAKIDALRSSSSPDEKSRHQQMRSIQEDTRTRLASVLTPAQLGELREMRGRMMGGHGHGGPGAPDSPGGPGSNGEAPPPQPPTE